MASGDRPGPIMRRAPSAVLLLAAFALLALALLLTLLPAPPAAAGPETQWVLTKTVVNPGKEKLEYRGGGSDPEFFGEERFKDMVMIYTPSATSFSIKDRWQDREYIAWDVTITCDFDAPEATLTPGKPYKLTASFSHSGTMTEPHPGEAFTYYSPDFGFAPNESLTYSPATQGFEDSFKTWSFTVPAASLGATMEIQAGLWNAPACTVVWKYEARAVAVDSTTSTTAADQGHTETQRPPTFTEEEFEKMLADTVAFGESHERLWPYSTELLKQGYIGYVVYIGLDTALYDHAGREVTILDPRVTGQDVRTGLQLIRIGDTITTGDHRCAVDLFTRWDSERNLLEIGPNSEVVFTRFGTIDQQVSQTTIGMLKGMVRFIGSVLWGEKRPSIFSVNAGTTLCGGSRGTDVVVSYDPNEETAGFWVREGVMDVENLQTGEAQDLTEAQGLVAQDGELGAVRTLTEDLWDDITLGSELDEVQPTTIVAVEQSDQPGGRPVVVVQFDEEGATTTTTPTTTPPAGQGSPVAPRPPTFTHDEYIDMQMSVASQAENAPSEYIRRFLMFHGYIGVLTTLTGDWEIYDYSGERMTAHTQRMVHAPGHTYQAVRIGDTIETAANGTVRIDLFDWDGKSPGAPSVINVGRDTTLVFTEFDCSSKEGTWVSVIRGGMRVGFKGSSSDSSFNIRAGTGLYGVRGSDVLLLYNPASDRAEAYVSEGRLDVSPSKTALPVSLKDGQRLVIQNGDYGTTEPWDTERWVAVVKAHGLTSMVPLTLEQLKDLGGSGTSARTWIIVGVAVAAFLVAVGLGVYLLRRRRKRTAAEGVLSVTMPALSTAFCRQCGSAITPGSTFCGGCGKRL